MPLDGRIEKRIPMGVPVYLVSLKEPRTAERVITENVSAHGARVVTKRHRQPGEDQRITPLSGQYSGAGASDLLSATYEWGLLRGIGLPGAPGQLGG